MPSVQVICIGIFSSVWGGHSVELVACSDQVEECRSCCVPSSSMLYILSPKCNAENVENVAKA